jgi:hypothetical protein
VNESGDEAHDHGDDESHDEQVLDHALGGVVFEETQHENGRIVAEADVVSQ